MLIIYQYFNIFLYESNYPSVYIFKLLTTYFQFVLQILEPRILLTNEYMFKY